MMEYELHLMELRKCRKCLFSPTMHQSQIEILNFIASCLQSMALRCSICLARLREPRGPTSPACSISLCGVPSEEDTERKTPRVKMLGRSEIMSLVIME
uniref:Uncharacterized protein n=1 Tax=Romanomermis culicivorax TaxID=13658 RepID=A0A915IX99_ROMCU